MITRMMYILGCLSAMTITAKTDQIKTTRISAVVDDHVIVQDITTDPDRNTMLAVVGEVKGMEDFKSTVNLHDFNSRFVALKNVNDGVCLLKPLSREKNDHKLSPNDIVMKNGEKFLTWHKTMYWNRDPKVMKFEEVALTAGELLAAFCRDYKTYKLSPKDISSLSTLSGRGRSKRCTNFCWNCNNIIDGYEDDIIDTGEKFY